jgi:uncharacterized cupredoxin-like copper-binding protein
MTRDRPLPVLLLIQTKSLTVDLPAGHYVLICNVPTHYTKGIQAEFTTS